MASSKGVLVDITKCVGCESCVVACRLYNDLDIDEENIAGPAKDIKTTLTAEKWTAVQGYSVERNGTKIKRFVKQQCFHCLEPACVNACFARALQKTPEGPVVYNEKQCVGCRYCMVACPFDKLKFEWDKSFPRVLKCQMCLARIAGDQMPACVSVCPTGALSFGDRDKIIQEANDLLASKPNRYINQIYGLKEVGGTSWLYISDVPFQQLGFNTGITSKPIPEYTWQVLKWTPSIFVGWGALLTGMYYYNKRRSEVHAEEEIYAPLCNK